MPLSRLIIGRRKSASGGSYFVLALSSFTLDSYDGGAGTSSVLDNSTFTLESGSI